MLGRFAFVLEYLWEALLWIWSLLTIMFYLAIGTVLIAVVALLVYQESLLYFPNMPPGSRYEYLTPQMFGLTEYFEEVSALLSAVRCSALCAVRCADDDRCGSLHAME